MLRCLVPSPRVLVCAQCHVHAYPPTRPPARRHLIHGPSQAPQRFLNMFPERNLSASAASYGMCGVCACTSTRTTKNHFDGSDDATWGQCRTVLAMAAALDWAVGATVDGLKDAHMLYNNTIIVYTCRAELHLPPDESFQMCKLHVICYFL